MRDQFLQLNEQKHEIGVILTVSGISSANRKLVRGQKNAPSNVFDVKYHRNVRSSITVDGTGKLDAKKVRFGALAIANQVKFGPKKASSTRKSRR